MISDFVMAVLAYGVGTLMLLIIGAIGGFISSIIPMCIHDYAMKNCSDKVRDVFFVVVCLLLPVIFGMMCAWTAYDRFSKTNPPVKQDPIVEIKKEVHRIKLLYLRPPKHVYVDFEDMNTGVSHDNVYVSKHCDTYAQNKGGDQYNVEVIYKTQGEKSWVEYQNLYQLFCQ